MAPKVTTRIYDPVTGALVNDQAASLDFGALAPFSKSSIMVVDAVISGVFSAGDLGVGIAASNIPEGLFPGTVRYAVVDSPILEEEPENYFEGVGRYNGTDHVVDVGFRSTLVSKYVAIMLAAPSRPLDSGCLILKWFFGFDKEV